ncbi:MAG: endonuclease III [Parachlamydiaceae bacterium]|nr:endonuclease III [Parachlamydiaceae bacterium]
MNQKDKARKIQRILNKLYPNPAIPLIHQSSYTLLIAVLLSAHCTDARVNKVTPDLFKRASTPEKMILLSIEEIQVIIRSCGLYKQKSKAIWNLSNILVEEYAGKVPESFEELEKLPGVGHKTASVVMSQAFNQYAFPVDTHIHRCAKRWGLSEGRTVKQTEKDLKELFPEKSWNRLHLQIIYFGREYCQARKHDPKVCPICSWVI